MQPH